MNIIYSLVDDDEEYAENEIYLSNRGRAVTVCFENENGMFVCNGEYISQVNYCPFTGKKADMPL
jgi:hypothetical protein|tara:strand:+ start:1602 stop:1793 length:192 start_codon:yes stop_codon:yes gene_type:complete